VYETTIYLLAGALVLVGWSCCRLFPKLPESGGVKGLRFWLALVLVVMFDRLLNTAFFTVETELFDYPDAVLAFIEAALLFIVTGVVLRQPASGQSA
jgi:hypothetical protein